MGKEVAALVEQIEALASRLPKLTQKADADMALMYLRHLQKQAEESR
ncbi:hypothetical protein [Amycolatopsis anabasis]|nr:hypothetical protein [Amycolatopsis anabasis]